MSETAAAPRRRTSLTHADVAQLIGAIHELTTRFDRLADVVSPIAPHIPTLIEVAKATDATRKGISTLGRISAWMEAATKRVWSMALLGVLIAMIWHARWKELIALVIGAAK